MGNYLHHQTHLTVHHQWHSVKFQQGDVIWGWTKQGYTLDRDNFILREPHSVKKGVSKFWLDRHYHTPTQMCTKTHHGRFCSNTKRCYATRSSTATCNKQTDRIPFLNVSFHYGPKLLIMCAKFNCPKCPVINEKQSLRFRTRFKLLVTLVCKTSHWDAQCQNIGDTIPLCP